MDWPSNHKAIQKQKPSCHSRELVVPTKNSKGQLEKGCGRLYEQKSRQLEQGSKETPKNVLAKQPQTNLEVKTKLP